jgi:aryl-alcohol dehydrogenase-like predicted oxidoreductase
VTGAIVGARDAAQIEGWIGAGPLHLTAQDMAEIAEAVWVTGAGSGPLEPARD